MFRFFVCVPMWFPSWLVSRLLGFAIVSQQRVSTSTFLDGWYCRGFSLEFLDFANVECVVSVPCTARMVLGGNLDFLISIFLGRVDLSLFAYN